MDIDLAIGGYQIRIEFSKDATFNNWPMPPFEHFITPSNIKPDLTFLVHIVPQLPDLAKRNLLFDACHGLWKLYDGGQSSILETMDTKTGTPRSRATVSSDFSTAEIWLATPQGLDRPDCTPMHIFNPIIEICLVTKLARERGFLLHSSAVVWNDNGWVFTGPSGAGKSTLADCFAAQGALVLSDERVIIRSLKHSFRMFGTPWVGTSLHAHNDSGPLTKLFCIQHGHNNHSIQPMSPMSINQWILQQCFLPHWDRQALSQTLETVYYLTEQIECSNLAFTKTPDIVDFLKTQPCDFPVPTA